LLKKLFLNVASIKLDTTKAMAMCVGEETDPGDGG